MISIFTNATLRQPQIIRNPLAFAPMKFFTAALIWLGLFLSSLSAAPTWDSILQTPALLPPEVLLTQDSTMDWTGPEGKIGSFYLKAGTKLATVRASGALLTVRYPALITLPTLDRSLFSEASAGTEGKPGRARLKEAIRVQINSPDGSPGPLLDLDEGAVLPAATVTATHVTAVEFTLTASIPWQQTNVLEAAAAIAETVQQELAAAAERDRQSDQLRRIEQANPAQSTPTETIPVKVTTTATYQTMEGFGTCLITWETDIAAFYETKAFEKAYIEDFGFNVLRVELAPQTLPRPVTNPQDIRMATLEMDRITSIFTRFARQLKKSRPDARIIGTVWSPPAWMKHTNSIGDPPLKAGNRSGSIDYNSYKNTQNYVKKEFYPHFVQWMVEIAKLYEKEGAGLYAISPGNEVLFTQWFQSCVWTAEDFATILAMLKPALEKNGLGHLKIFGPETMTSHTFSNQPFLHVLLKHPGGRALDVFATHGYTDGVRGDTKAQSSSEFWGLIEKQKKPYWITEGGTGGHQWPAPVRPQGTAEFFHNNIVFGRASKIVPWQIVERVPNEHGQMLLSGYTKKSHTTMHFTRFIQPGAVRVRAEPAQGAVLASAYVHPQGPTTIVIVNPHAAALAIELSITGKAPSSLRMWRTSATEDVKEIAAPTRAGSGWEFVLPGHSIVTLQGT